MVLPTRFIADCLARYQAALCSRFRVILETTLKSNQQVNPRIENITSPTNPLVKELRRAIGRGSLTTEGYCIAESFHLLEEARRTGCEIPAVLMSESAFAKAGDPEVKRLLILPDVLFQTITTTESSQGIIALVRPPEWEIADLFKGQSLVVVLDGIQDPGNAGAIVRAAEAFGATGVIFMKGTASPSNPKTLRASAGSLFRVPCVTGLDGATVRAALQKERVVIYAAMPYTGSEHLAEDLDFNRRCAIIIGSEGHGIGAELVDIAEPVAIPTGGVESLNAAVAAAVLLYETRRQRGPVTGKSV
jgi:TrmH family RNA methyltransferase